jgi:hypothetical protein
MIDNFLLKTSVKRLNITEIVKLCIVAEEYEMIQLLNVYIAELKTRLNLNSISEVIGITHH